MNTSPRIGFDDLTACPSCDALHYRVTLEPGEIARCDRCGVVVQTRKPRTVDRSLAAVVALLILLVLALCLPFLALSRSGLETRISLFEATIELWRNDFLFLGLSALVFLVCLPIVRCLLLGFALLCIRFGKRAGDKARFAFRWSVLLGPWAMADIFMIGVVVSLVKVASLARLEIGLAFWALLGAIFVSAFLESSLCRDTVWDALGES